MTIRGIITLLVLVVLFALAVIWISKKGGWSGGCGWENPPTRRPTPTY